MRKGEIACNKQFLLFLTMFSSLYGTYFSCKMHLKMSSAICFNLDQSKILSSGNRLMQLHTIQMNVTNNRDGFRPYTRRMHYGKKEKMLIYQHFLLLPQCV